MTPSEKCGYKVGDNFIFLATGAEIILHEDDNSTMPWFIDGKGKVFRAHLMYIKAIVFACPTKNRLNVDIHGDSNLVRVGLRKIPRYNFNPGDVIEVSWDGTEICEERNSNTRVVFLGNQNCGEGISHIAYVNKTGTITRGFVKTSNLRPE